MKGSKHARNQTFLELFIEQFVSFGAYNDIKKKKKEMTLHYIYIVPNLFFSSVPHN
jgi:hypothetical protein